MEVDSSHPSIIKKETLPKDHLKKKDSQKKLQSDVISTIKERRLCYIKVAPPKYVQDESLDAIEVKPDINHLMIFEDHFEQPCCVCMEDKQTHYSVNEKWDGLTIEDVIEFTTGLRLHQAELKKICRDCYLRMKVAYRFRLDCDKARDILAAIPAPSIHEPVEITSNSAKPQKKKRKLETSKNLVEDLFTFKNSGDSKDKSFVKIKKETNYVEVVLANPGTEKRLHHTCYMCKIEFPTTTLKAMHNEEVHKKDGLMICTYTSCNYTALSWKELCKHAFNHRPSIFMCDACGHKFKNPQALNAHMIIHIDDPEEKDKLKHYPCKQCSKKFSSSSRLSKHKRTHNKECFFKCKNCDKAYRTDITLKNHLMNVHGLEPKFMCNGCGSGFMQENGYRKHMDICSK